MPRTTIWLRPLPWGGRLQHTQWASSYDDTAIQEMLQNILDCAGSPPVGGRATQRNHPAHCTRTSPSRLTAQWNRTRHQVLGARAVLRHKSSCVHKRQYTQEHQTIDITVHIISNATSGVGQLYTTAKELLPALPELKVKQQLAQDHRYNTTYTQILTKVKK